MPLGTNNAPPGQPKIKKSRFFVITLVEFEEGGMAMATNNNDGKDQIPPEALTYAMMCLVSDLTRRVAPGPPPAPAVEYPGPKPVAN